MVAGMNCFPCFNSQKSKKSNSRKDDGTDQENVVAKPPDVKKQKPEDGTQVDASNITAKHFTFRELATATKNFRQECLICEAGFGRVYKGIIPTTGQVVAVKQLDRNGMHGSKEFMSEVNTLSLLHHENIVNFVGYCADGDQRLLVYEFVQGGNLEEHLLVKDDQAPLDWFTRMKVAAGVANGLQYLHESANPPIIFRDMKPSNIWLDKDFNAKLFDFALSNQSAGDKNNPAPPRVMGTYGYCAPEYVRTGCLTMKSDVYSFGVVLLELITGRRAVDTTKPNEEQNLVSWAQPLFRDPKRYPDMADPLLHKNFPEKDLNQVVAIAAMCLQEEAEARPLMSDAVTALSFLSAPPPAAVAPVASKSLSRKKSAACGGKSGSGSDCGSKSDGEYQSGSESSYTKSRRRNSTRSRSKAHDSGSESGSASSSYRGSSRHHGDMSQKKTSRKSSSREAGEKSSKKNSNKELSKKSTKKVSSNDKEHRKKSSRKSSLRFLSHKSSMRSEDGTISMSRHSSSVFSDEESDHHSRVLSQRGVSFGLISSSSSVEEGSIHSSMRSDEGSGHHRSSNASHRESVDSR